MKADVNLEIYAIAVGVEGSSGVGKIAHVLEITTGSDSIHLPVMANILLENARRTATPSHAARFQMQEPAVWLAERIVRKSF